MEQIIKEWARGAGFPLTEDMADKLNGYARLIQSENELYNLTGLKTVDDIMRTLIIKSIDPVRNMTVPRGTSFIDIGTGAGIPGIVLSICFPGFHGTLVDANGKKTDFIKKAATELGIDALTVINARAEDVGQEKKFRESFDWSFTRAFGPIYYSFEFALPVLKDKGMLYIFSNLEMNNLSGEMIAHIRKLGGMPYDKTKHSSFGIGEEGLLVLKDRKTSALYPRRFPIIKRDSEKVSETK
ncbi:MAG: 16S rRNA (guanine(527)-N(7))-methyltransferase RsmG [Spirochaetota bacterium]